MKIVLPSNTNHSIDLIPRYYPVGSIDLYLYNEVTKVETLTANTYVTASGLLTIDFALVVSEGDKYQIKITDNEGVVFRGKLLATEQPEQSYKLTAGKYYYE